MEFIDKYMTQLFGTAWQLVGDGAVTAAADVAPGFSAGVFQFNIFSMIAVAIMLLLVTLLATVNTATDGQPLGKSYHTLWTPFRMGFGILMVTPVSSLGGINIVQALILFSASLSIQGANMIYGKIMEGFRDTGNIYASVNASPKFDLAMQMLTSEMCTLAAREKLGQNYGMADVQAREKINDTMGASYYEISYGHYGEATPICGKVYVDCRNLSAEAATERQQQSLLSTLLSSNTTRSHDKEVALAACRTAGKSMVAMQPAIAAAAMSIFQQNYGISDLTQFKNSFKNAMTAYFTTYNLESHNVLSALRPASNVGVNQLHQQAVHDGWLFAGGYFLATSRKSAEVSRHLSSVDKYISTQSVYPPAFSQFFNEVEIEIKKAETAVRKIQPSVAKALFDATEMRASGLVTTQDSHGPQSKTEEIMRKLFNDPLLPVWKSWRLVSEDVLNGDPLKALASWGGTIGAAAGAMGTAYLATVAAAGAAKGAVDNSLLSKFPGVGAATGATTGAAEAVVSALSHWLQPLVDALSVLSFMLTTFIPMIPAVYWSFSVVGWFLTLLVIFIAAPLWAAVHALPDDRSSPISMWAVNGYQMLFGVLVKPSLMVLFLFAAMTIAAAGTAIATKIFDIAGITTILADGGFVGIGDVLQAIGLLALYVIVVTIIVYKSFTLIFTGADRAIDVLGWKVLQSGVEDTENRVQGSAKEAAVVGSRPAGALASKANDSADEVRKKRSFKEKSKNDNPTET